MDRMLTALRLAGLAIVALFAGISVPTHAPSIDAAGEYAWRLRDHSDYAGLTRGATGTSEIAGTLVLTRSLTGYDASMTSATFAAPYPFLVSVVEDRVIVYADTELGELRFDLPSVPGVPAEWTLRTEEWGELRGRLELSR
jgi:hypothetical protein